MGYSVFPAATAASGMANPKIKQTINATTSSISVPTEIGFVYAILIGGGGGGGGSSPYGGTGGQGGFGGFTFGYTPFASSVTIGAGGNAGTNSIQGPQTGYDIYYPSGGSAGGKTTYGILSANGAQGGTASYNLDGNVSVGTAGSNGAGRDSIGTGNLASVPISGFSGNLGSGGPGNGSPGSHNGAAATAGSSGSLTLMY